MSIHGVVLAAGRSERMGRNKALLYTPEGTLLARAVETLRRGGCGEVVVVANEKAADVREAAEPLARVIPARDVAGAAPIDSLRLALRGLPATVSAVLVLPVDCPLVRPATVSALIERFRHGDVAGVVPAWRGTHGHPVLLGRGLFDDARERDLAEGLRTLIALRSTEIAIHDTDDESIIVDLDTPEDARRHGVPT